MREKSIDFNWLAFVGFGLLSLIGGWLGYSLTGAPMIALAIFALLAGAGYLVVRSGKPWLRIMGISTVLLMTAFFAYAALIFYLNYG